MATSCPHCRSQKTTSLSLLNSALSGSEVVLSSTGCTLSTHPPTRRQIHGRVALFFLAAASLAWPLNMLLAYLPAALHADNRSQSQYGFLPPDASSPESSADSQSSTPVARDYTQPRHSALPTNITVTSILVALQFAVLVLLACNLHRARRYNQTVWGPAFERWSASRYCNCCHQVFVSAAIAQAIPKPFASTAANTPAA